MNADGSCLPKTCVDTTITAHTQNWANEIKVKIDGDVIWDCFSPYTYWADVPAGEAKGCHASQAEAAASGESGVALTDYGVFEHTKCLEPGSTHMILLDSYGDGFHGGYVTINGDQFG